MLEYARDGLVGLLTPQANITAEAEFRLLAGDSLGVATARLTSDEASIEARLIEYVDQADATLAQFASAPLSAAAFACTGSSYIVGPSREAAWTARIEAVHGLPFVTAAAAVASALDALGATRVAAVSPYGADLAATALAYWTARGIEVAHVETVNAASDAAHPIYEITSGVATAGAARAARREVDAVVLFGTGMPTLRAILETGRNEPPRLSSMLCLAWLASARARGCDGDKASLERLASGADWASRLPSSREPALESSP